MRSSSVRVFEITAKGTGSSGPDGKRSLYLETLKQWENSLNTASLVYTEPKVHLDPPLQDSVGVLEDDDDPCCSCRTRRREGRNQTVDALSKGTVHWCLCMEQILNLAKTRGLRWRNNTAAVWSCFQPPASGLKMFWNVWKQTETEQQQRSLNRGCRWTQIHSV